MTEDWKALLAQAGGLLDAEFARLEAEEARREARIAEQEARIAEQEARIQANARDGGYTLPPATSTPPPAKRRRRPAPRPDLPVRPTVITGGLS